MKKVLCTAVLAMAGFVSQAQDNGFKFGAKLGPNFSTITGDISESGVKVGFHVGLFAEVMVNENFGVQPELLFSMQGTSNNYNYNYGGYNDYYDYGVEKVNLSYVTVPVMATYHFNRVKGLSVQLGPQVGVLVAAKYKVADDYFGDGAGAQTIDVKDSFNTVDVGIGAGAQYEFPFKLIVSIRGVAGLTNILDEGNQTWRNNVIQISAAYSFL